VSFERTVLSVRGLINIDLDFVGKKWASKRTEKSLSIDLVTKFTLRVLSALIMVHPWRRACLPVTGGSYGMSQNHLFASKLIDSRGSPWHGGLSSL
jgi:hypothetical protein